jgi:hypothetical protein
MKRRPDQPERDTFPSEFLAGRTADDLARLNATFLVEAEAHGLVFECGDCEHWNPPGADCSMGYPTAGILAVRGGASPTKTVLHDTGHTHFCKHFEPL